MTPVASSTGLFYERAKSAMGALGAKADRLQVDIATTRRLQAPSDDSVAYQRLQRITRDTADAGAWDANLGLAGSLLAQADTTLDGMTTQVQRASELMLRANTGTMSLADRRTAGAELAQIVESLVELANAGDTRGRPLFGGTDGRPAVAVDAGAFTYSVGTPAAIPVGDGQQVQPTELASRLFDLGGGKDTLAVLQALSVKLLAGTALDTGEGDAAVADLAAADEQLTAVRASLGARGARVDLLQAQSTAIATDREAERSGLEDTDYTVALADLQKTMTVLSATQASFSKLAQLSLFDYLR